MGLWVGKSWRKVASSTRSRMILLSGCSSSDFLTSSSTATLYFHPLVVYDFRPILHQNGRSRKTRSLIVLMKNEPKVNHDYIETEIHGSGRSILGV